MNDKKYVATDGKKMWYSNKIVFDQASGVVEFDDGRRVMVNPVKFKFFLYSKKEDKK